MKECGCYCKHDLGALGVGEMIFYCKLHANSERMKEFIEMLVNGNYLLNDHDEEAQAILKEIDG